LLFRGQTLGKYRIIAPLGSGGFGTVYLAEDTWIDKKVAIKVPHRQGLDFGELLREPRLLASVSHPNIVSITTAEKQDNVFFIVMEYVHGETLENLIAAQGCLDLNRSLDFTCQICNAVDHAHRQGVIHRDLRPANVLVTENDMLKVADFGTSRFLEIAAHGTTVIGSPPYMAPEQFQGKAVFASDIYSLGVTMYRLLTGRLPYYATTQAGLVYAILNTPPAAPATLRPELPPLLDRIVLKAIAKDPAKRYASWLEFGSDLSQAFTALKLVSDTVTDSEKFSELRNMPFFEDFGDVALWEVVRIGSWSTLPANRIIIREGDEGDSCYLLVKGEVAVTLEAQELAQISSGGCFGEMVYFAKRQSRRNTTVTARSEVTIIEIKASALRAATDSCQNAFNKAVTRVLIERLVQTNKLLAQAVTRP
jgi:eukaryotic-like serine/threonine-protein kinase